MSLLQHAQAFRDRLRSRAPLCGTFIKTPHYQMVELAAGTGLDFVVLDAEHAPFGRSELDTCLLAAAATGVPALVRLPGHDGPSALQTLDLGAAGILVPHVVDAASARAAVASARYLAGNRGFSNSPRAGQYGGMPQTAHVSAWDAAVSVLCQIEDRAAIDNIDDIIRVEGIDCLFIGRADLAVSYGVTELDHPVVEQAVGRVLKAAQEAGIATGIFLADARAVAHYAGLGVSLFLLGSEQSALKSALSERVRACTAALNASPANL